MDKVEEFEAQRPRLFSLAYRLLGSAAEAEDAVQDAYLRWHGAEREDIAAPGAWLAKVLTNLCLNRLTSARAQREEYVGPWLPEPVRTDGGVLGPMETAEQRDTVSMAMLVMMERLTPAERAVVVLRDAFEYGYREIAGVLGLSEANARQVHRRARQHLTDGRSRFVASARPGSELVWRFLAAAEQGSLPQLEALLAEDVTAWSDGGGKVSAALRPVSGRAKVARFVLGLFERWSAGLEIEIAEANGEPLLLCWAGDELSAAAVVETGEAGITGVRIVRNPDKLRFLSRQSRGMSQSG